MLVEWVVDWAELLIGTAQTDTEAETLLTRLCRRGRAIGRFVLLWTETRTHGAAVQLAAVERFGWPLPSRHVEAGDLMQRILAWENQHRDE